MRYLVSFDDGVYIHQAIVEAPGGTDEFSLLELATTRYNLGNKVSDDYYRNRMDDDLRRWGYTEEEIEETRGEYIWSDRLNAWLSTYGLWAQVMPPNVELGYGRTKYTRFRPRK